MPKNVITPLKPTGGQEALAGTKVDPGDILLIIDKVNKEIQAIKNEKETVPFKKKHENEFLKIDKSSVLENYISNLSRQYEDPTRFRILTLPAEAVSESIKELNKLFKNNPPQSTLQFVEEHAVKRQVDPAEKPSEGLDENQPKKYYINENMVNWEGIEKDFGISRTYLANKGYLEPLLKGGKTPGLVPITLKTEHGRFRGTARLYFTKDSLGVPKLEGKTPKPFPDLSKSYYSYNFTPKDKENLQEFGVLGHTAFLAIPGPKEKPKEAGLLGQLTSPSPSVEIVEAIVGLDPYTNDLIAARVDKVFIRNEVGNTKLSDDEKDALKNGKILHREDFVSSKDKEYEAHYFVHPDTRGITMKFPNQDIMVRKSIGGVSLNDEQLEAYAAGKAIRVDGMKYKNGDTYSRFIRKNKISQLPEFFKYNPDSPENNREIIIPDKVYNQTIPEELKETFTKGEPIWINDMQRANGDNWDGFVKLDISNGEVASAANIEDFHQTLDEKMEQKFKIPNEIWKHKFSRQEKTDLRAGKTLYITDFVGFNNTQFPSWVKADMNAGKLQLFEYDPDAPKKDTRMDKGQDQEQGQGKGQGVA